MKKYISTIGLCLLLGGVNTVVNAQNLNLNKGDEYKVTTLMSSSSSMKRGDKTLDVKSISKLTKSYMVTDATNSGYNLSMSVTNVADTIDGFNQKLAYNSNRAADPASAIETGLRNLVGTTHALNLDKSGKVTQVANADKAMSDAAVAGSAGVYFDNMAVGKTLKLGANFKLPAGASKGTTWKEENKASGVTTKTTYKVDETSAKQTKVSFTSESAQTGINTNTSGVMVLDNNSGVVVQRVLKIDSKGNSSLDGKTFITSTKRTLSESCEKVK